MEEKQIFTIPNFSDSEYFVNGDCECYTFEKDVGLDWLWIKIFPNGNTPDDEGHVSMTWLTVTRIDVSYLNCTVSVVDGNGKSCYPTSFGIKGGVYEEWSSLAEFSFVRRCVVLDPDKELLCGETLTLQFDISWDVKWNDGFKFSCGEMMKMHVENMESSRNSQSCLSGIDPLDWEQFRKTEIEKFPFAGMFDVGNPPLSKHPFVSQLRSDDSPLCERLREKPQYYESLFRKAVVRRKHDFLFNVEFKIFGYISRDLMIFLKKENLDHVDIVDKCIALYYLNHKYGMFDLKAICSERLKCLLTSEKAVEVLDVAQLCQDEGLRDCATVHILLNSKEVKNSAEWTVLREKCPVLAKVVSRLANDMEVQNLGIEAGLRRLVLRYILINWSEVQKYMKWTTTLQTLIVSCVRKDFELDFLNLNEFASSNEFGNLNEFNVVEEYGQHAEDYDFYR